MGKRSSGKLEQGGYDNIQRTNYVFLEGINCVFLEGSLHQINTEHTIKDFKKIKFIAVLKAKKGLPVWIRKGSDFHHVKQ